MPDPFPSVETPTGVVAPYIPYTSSDDLLPAEEQVPPPPLEEATPPLMIQPPAMAPGVPRSSSGVPLVAPPNSVQWTNAAQPPTAPAGDIYSRVRDLPIDQAASAVSTALKFQGIRGYQRDLEAGKSPAEALAKWAPIMFTAPKEGNLGQAAALARTARPATPMIRDVAGQLIRVNPDGTTTALTPPKPARPSTFDVQEHKSYLDQIRALEKELDDDPSGPEADKKRQKLQYLRSQAEAVRNRVNAPAGGKPQRIRVKSKAGKIGTIPADQLDAALAEGYTRVQ
jgi:hypothetical protein